MVLRKAAAGMVVLLADIIAVADGASRRRLSESDDEDEAKGANGWRRKAGSMVMDRSV